MPIRVLNGTKSEVLQKGAFDDESHLQNVLAQCPDLLRQDGEPTLALVATELDLPYDGGRLDLLFVSSEGLPIAVEVKLQANGESRREVVAQAVDYLSALTMMTNDELDDRTKGNLSKALASFDTTEDEKAVERRWSSVGANLRAGLARVIIAVDSAPDGLERITRFLASSSELDIQLVAVEPYSSNLGGEVMVPRFLVSGTSTQRRALPSPTPQPNPVLLDAVTAYNEQASEHMQATGSARNYRQVRCNEWPAEMRTHYELICYRKRIGADLHIESDKAKPLAEVLKPFAGEILVPGTPPLTWDPTWSSDRGRLTCQMPADTPAETVAKVMVALIDRTKSAVDDYLCKAAAGKRRSTK